MNEIIGWCPDCDGPLYLLERRTMEGRYRGPSCSLCGIPQKGT